MNKRFLALIITLVICFSSIPAYAASAPNDRSFHATVTTEKAVIFSDKIVVTPKGGTYEVGFVTLYFPKNFIDKLPATFEVKVCAKDGVAGVEVTPSTSDFNKDVIILVDHYKGQLYDVDKGKNIEVKVKPQVIIAKHFSWHFFR